MTGCVGGCSCVGATCSGSVPGSSSAAMRSAGSPVPSAFVIFAGEGFLSAEIINERHRGTVNVIDPVVRGRGV